MAMAVDTGILTLLLLLHVMATHTAGIPRRPEIPVEPVKYLQYFGYAPGLGERTPLTTEEERGAFLRFQRFNGLPLTGRFDEATRELMSRARCDLPDYDNIRVPRFAVRFTKWNNDLRWKLDKAETIPSAEGERIMQEAVQEWQKWMTLKVTQSTDADSELLVSYLIPDADGNHGDSLAFKSNTLAHAFYPGGSDLSGDIHFNMERPFSWQYPTPLTAYDIKHTAIHELGHALGIKHTSVSDAIMYAYARRGNNYTQLHSDDILAIAELYGRCYQMPCQNGGTCTHVATMPGYFCMCQAPYTGTDCETEDKCAASPCQNGGTCTNDAGALSGYSCNCPVTHIGDNCDQANACFNNPCKNGGTCNNAPSEASGYTCQCPNTHTGDTCGQVATCFNNPCQNGGTCNPASNSEGYTCSCPSSYTGPQCTESQCNSNPCPNGEVCTLANNDLGYTCSTGPSITMNGAVSTSENLLLSLVLTMLTVLYVTLS